MIINQKLNTFEKALISITMYLCKKNFVMLSKRPVSFSIIKMRKRNTNKIS